LAGEADGSDVGGFKPGAFSHGAGGGDGGFPPVEGVLLGPAGFWGGDGVFGHRGGEDFAFFVADEGFGSAGADVDAEEVGHGGGPCGQEPAE